ncbi:LuxR C-terminal-related transcriptional regulator [Streptomyces rimosus]|uniref:LuxR C-terminal-related transcriptional regulator n=1 Tax=Streptomyces rimosus TaxID=1927 RepID=UPI0007C4707C|nr:LuxR C-terminal-related transcriptional regulator [Streptomyces rimosus]
MIEGNIPLESVPECLKRLQLLVESQSPDGRAFPVPPVIAAEAALRPLEETMARLRREAAQIRAAVGAYDSVYSEVRSREEQPLTVIRGTRAISHALEAAVSGCAGELITAQPGGGRPAELLREALGRSLPLLARGVRQRTLYQHSVRTHRPTLAYIRRITAEGAEVRTLAEMFDRLIICDQAVAFIPTCEETADTAMEIRHPALIRYLTVMFERHWARAVPVDPSAGTQREAPVLDDLQRVILRAMVEGETDERIARRIGLSRRTVVAHIRKVSEHFNSSSRAQLGFLLASSGLLDGDGDDERSGPGAVGETVSGEG